MRRWWRWIGWTAGAVLLVLLLGVLWLWLHLRASLPQLDGEAEVAGLEQPVRIERDAQGVPLIHARNRLDAARALGWLHAQDRFFQMDLNRRVGAGELSELLGAALVGIDGSLRFFDGRRIAAEALARLSVEERALVDAYTAGVNAGLGALGALPPEYLRPGVEVRPWAAEDCFLTALSMYFDLQDSKGRLDETWGLLRERMPPEVVEFLRRQTSVWDASIDGSEGRSPLFPREIWAAALEAVDQTAGHPPAGPEAKEAAPPLTPMPTPTPPPAEGVGSNAWAVAGTATADGRAIVANDMHLGLRVPHIWYRTGWRITGRSEPHRTVDGVTLPGMPLMVAGSNRRVAWGFTNSYIDTTDLIRLEIRPEDRHYRTAEGWEPLVSRTESIRVLGSEPVEYSMADTRWGPVRDGPGGDGGILYAVCWAGAQPWSLNLRLLDMETAHSVDEAIAVAHRASIPTQNLIVGDRDGRLAWTLFGPVPDRGGIDGTFPMSAEEWSDGWAGRLPPERYPVMRPEEEARLWSANQRMVGEANLDLLGDGGYGAGYRASRIRAQLRTRVHNEKSLLALQGDVAVPHMERWRELARRAAAEPTSPASEGRGAVLAALKRWDGRASPESTDYPIMRSLYRALLQRGEARLLAPMGDWRDALWLTGAASLDEAIYTVMAEDMDELAPPEAGSWRAVILEEVDALARSAAEPAAWGEVNRLRMQHPFAEGLPFLSRWLDMPPTPLPGDVYTVRVQRPAFGASERMVVSPGREAEGFYHQPGGASGHFLSPFYRSGHEDWEQLAPSPFLPGPAEHVLTLLPARAR